MYLRVSNYSFFLVKGSMQRPGVPFRLTRWPKATGREKVHHENPPLPRHHLHYL
jgi:hypothetical protein